MRERTKIDWATSRGHNMFDIWEDLLEHGTTLDIEIEARAAINRGEDVPFDVVVRLTEAGIIL